MAWLKETLLGLILLAALNAGFAPDDPGLLHLRPHPLLFLVAVVALRHGTRAGLFSGLLAAGVHATSQAVEAREAGGLAGVLSAVSPVYPIVLAATGTVLGRLRQGHVRREEAARRHADEIRTERDALRTRLAIAEHARHELERRLLEPAATMAVLHEAAERLESIDAAGLWPAVVEIAVRHLHAEACAAYALDGGKLRRMAFRGGAAPPPEERDPAVGLLGLALRERRVASARDLVGRPELATGGLETVLAAPLFSSDGTPLGVIAVASMPFLSLTASAQRIAGMLASWAARAVERTRFPKGPREKAVYDEAVGVLTYSTFVDRLAEEFERGRRYSEPFSILILEILAFDMVPPDNRETLRRAVAQVLKNTLRRVDVVYLYKDVRSFAVTLAHTGADGAERARDRICREIDRLGLEPYRREGRLDYAIGVAAATPEMRSPAELAMAAENRAASPAAAAAPGERTAATAERSDETAAGAGVGTGATGGEGAVRA